MQTRGAIGRLNDVTTKRHNYQTTQRQDDVATEPLSDPALR